MFRADAFTTLYCIDPLQRLSLRAPGIPILMYHSVSSAEEGHHHPYHRTVTAPDVFARQMLFLADNGYRTVAPCDIVNASMKPGEGHQRSVAITFDDGYRDFYRTAYPILNKYDLSATVYLPTAYIGNTNQHFKGHECLTWHEVRELHKAGVEFGSHTVSHPQLSSLRTKDVEYEVTVSKATIEDRLGSEVRTFAYPYAFPESNRRFTATLRSLLRQAGYENGVTTIIGTANQGGDPWLMRRLPVNSCDSPALFRAKLGGAYNWMHSIQYASKLLR